MEYAELVMIPNELTDVCQLEQYNILSSKINIIPTLVHQYCEKSVSKATKVGFIYKQTLKNKSELIFSWKIFGGLLEMYYLCTRKPRHSVKVLIFNSFNYGSKY